MPSTCPSNTCTGAPILRTSQRATVVSVEPVASKNSLRGLKDTLFTSSEWAVTRVVGAAGALLSHKSSCLSSPAEANMCAWCLDQSTSSTPAVWPWKVSSGCTSTPASERSHKQTRLSSAPLSSRPSVCGFQLTPYPSALCPMHRCWGRHSSSVGRGGCCARSNTYTVGEGALVAIKLEFWGMALARLTSPSWRIFFVISILLRAQPKPLTLSFSSNVLASTSSAARGISTSPIMR
mmetsp:Transcript_20875/g.45181  ORF Transcript_20875/g.45181 Transcript_20875/m.45181 type:complete len:236 (-) Transcript_20875:291-998(-)